MLPTTLTIDISAEDIAHGVKRNCQECPAALAATRALRALPAYGLTATISVTVVGNQIDVSARDGYATYYDDNEDLSVFIYEFDNGHDVQPTSITVMTRSTSLLADLV